MTEQPRIDRLPPHSDEAEQGVLGCILLAPNESIGECVEKLASREAFYDLRHQTIYQVLVDMFDARAAIDLITLQQKLKDSHLLEEVGGIAYLSSLSDAVPSAANLSYYLAIVEEKYVLRRLIRVTTEIAGRIFDFEGDVDRLMDEVERDVLAIRQLRTDRKTPPIKQLMQGALDKIEEYHVNQGAIMGVATGYTDLDRKTIGLKGGNMVVIAARPSVGKTSLAMNIAEHVAVDLGLPVGVFSLEMTADELAFRLLCSRSRVNFRNVRDGVLAERDFPKLANAAGKIARCGLHIDDGAGVSILQLRAKARRMWQQYGIKLFVIDYLQLLKGTRRYPNRQEEIAEISIGVKNLAKELNVPVIVLAQLNRDSEREKRIPRLSDLRESGAIEQDADIVGMLYRPPDQDEDEDAPLDDDTAIAVNLLIAKHRNGPTGDIPLTFLRGLTRFENASRIDAADIPQISNQTNTRSQTNDP